MGFIGIELVTLIAVLPTQVYPARVAIQIAMQVSVQVSVRVALQTAMRINYLAPAQLSRHKSLRRTASLSRTSIPENPPALMSTHAIGNTSQQHYVYAYLPMPNP